MREKILDWYLNSKYPTGTTSNQIIKYLETSKIQHQITDLFDTPAIKEEENTPHKINFYKKIFILYKDKSKILSKFGKPQEKFEKYDYEIEEHIYITKIPIIIANLLPNSNKETSLRLQDRKAIGKTAIIYGTKENMETYIKISKSNVNLNNIIEEKNRARHL
ncbi:hypothetical protein K9M18_05385 [Candidatus Woesearchaeota archaeon]|nr:hypothetical protein [Candidatus Woesearchaeota archaeon]MCF8013009.1 hypothetical protein [Candidatus Woesearchaeota archaeon]